MLRVSYKNRIGYYTHTDRLDDIERKGKVWICHANALCAFMYFYKDKDGTNMTQLMGFCADLQHLKNLVKDGWFTPCSNFHFYAEEMDSEMWKMVKILANGGIKVTIESKHK